MKTTILALICLAMGCNVLLSQTGSVLLKNSSNTTISTHSTIAEAYSALPGTLAQSYFIELSNTYTGAFETYPITFTNKTGASASNVVTLRPATGVTGMTIQASLATANSGVIVLNDADYMVIDGRPGGTGSAGVLTFNNTSTAANANTIVFINGSCFNTIRYCNVFNSTTGSAGRNIFLAASASNVTGNSDNNFFYCVLTGGRYQLNSNGTAANSNTRNLVRGCRFSNATFAALWAQAGTARITVDSCDFFCTTPTGSGLYFGIVFDSQKDTATITNNRLYDIQDLTVGVLRYIHVRSVLANAANYVDIRNNFFSMMTGNATLVNIGMIELEGTGGQGRIAHNSFRIGGTQTANGTSGSVSSAAIVLASSSSLSFYEIRNNLMVNERSGGSGVQHVAMNVVNTAPTFTIHNNTYNASGGDLIRWGTTVYTSISAYQLVVPGGEPGANNTPVPYVSTNDLHLPCSTWTTSTLRAPAIAGITKDIDNDLRSLSAFRGADEALAFSAVVHAPCGGGNGSATVNPGPGTYFYAWSPTGGNAATASGLATGPYTVSVNDGINCAATITLNITQQTANFTTTVSALNNVSCFGLTNGAATVGVLGNPGTVTYSWLPAGGTSSASSGLAPGNYTITVTNSGSCSAVQTLTVTQPPAILISATGNSSVCSGSTATLTAMATGGAGAFTYSWSGGPALPTHTVSPTVNTTYSVEATDANSCTVSTTFSVVVYSLPQISVNSGSVCLGGSFTITPAGATSYSYSSGSNIVTPSANETYTVTGSDANGCEHTALSNVFVFALPVVAVNSGSVCSGSSFTLVPSGASSYSYSGGSNIVAPVINESFTVTGTDDNGCTGTAVADITVTALPGLSVSATQSFVCVNTATVSLTGLPGGGTFSGQHVNGNVFTPAAAGVFPAIYSYTDAATTCTNTATVSITVDLCDALASSMANGSVSLFPNPNTGVFRVTFTDTEARKINLSDATGRTLLSIESRNLSEEFEVTELPAGLYYLHVVSENADPVKLRFIKE